jgi:hypothetical protein
VTLDQIAELLEAEAKGAEGHADPVVRAMALRLRIVATELAAQPRPKSDGLTNPQTSATVSDVAMSDRPLANELLEKTGMRPHALWKRMKAAGEPVPSHETFHVIFSGRGKARVSPELREAVKRHSGIVLP